MNFQDLKDHEEKEYQIQALIWKAIRSSGRNLEKYPNINWQLHHWHTIQDQLYVEIIGDDVYIETFKFNKDEFDV